MALSEEQMAERLEEVKKIQVILDPDPTTKGLASLNLKLTEMQLAKDRVTSLLLESMKNVAELEILKEICQNEHDRQLELLMVTEQSCLAAKSADARNVAARIKMPELVLKLHHKDISLIKGQWFMKCIQLVHSNLESANSNLSRQITVVQLDQNLQGGNGGNMNRSVTKSFNL